MLASLSKRLLMTLPNRRHISTADTSPRSNETNLRGRWRRRRRKRKREEGGGRREEGKKERREMTKQH